MERHVLIAQTGYLISLVLLIFGLKGLAKVRTAVRANRLAAYGMLFAVISQSIEQGVLPSSLIVGSLAVGTGIGVLCAVRVAMTALPQLVAILNGLGGCASALVALAMFVDLPGEGSLLTLYSASQGGVAIGLTVVLSVAIGALTFSGSALAYLKLSDRFGDFFGKSITWTGRKSSTLIVALALVMSGLAWHLYLPFGLSGSALAGLTTLFSLILGVLVVLPIGGADMPVVVSLLNSYSGVAASATGFVVGSPILIVAGALVGSAGLILTQVMCKAMNRSLMHVLVGGFGESQAVASKDASGYEFVKQADVSEAALDFDSARRVIIVPGYGLAVAQGQHAISKLFNLLQARGCTVQFAIHPVAGRMPGHMNVLLAESQIPHDHLVEMSEINDEFKSADIALVVGANDVVNPAARTDHASPIFGMPILNVDFAKQVYVIKRSLSPGFAGVKNKLFEMQNCHMIYGDAKKILESLTGELGDPA